MQIITYSSPLRPGKYTSDPLPASRIPRIPYYVPDAMLQYFRFVVSPLDTSDYFQI